MPRYLMTASLLNAWKYAAGPHRTEEGRETAMASFLQTLYREPVPDNEAMRKGREFEEWARQNIPELQGSVYQASLYADIPGYLLHGKLDFLRAGIITDTKRPVSYSVGKYFGSPQTAMYLRLVPEALQMDYLIGCNHQLYRETYRRDEVPPIETYIASFRSWLKAMGIDNIFQEKWRAKDDV